MKKEGIYQEIARKLTELRKGKGLSQDEIAKQLGMAQSTYAGYEAANRKVPMDILVRLADYFYVSIDFLLGKESRFKVIASDNLFGRRIQEARSNLNLTQKDLAETLHVSEQKVDEMEKGMHIANMSARLISQLAIALNVARDYLLGNPDEEELRFSPSDTVGDRLRKIREAAHRTKYEVASALGVPVIAVDDWEHNAGDMSRELRLHFCELHGIPHEAFRDTLIPMEKKPSMHVMGDKESDMLLAIEGIYLTLNEEGRAKLLDYAQDISTSPKYSSIDN